MITHHIPVYVDIYGHKHVFYMNIQILDIIYLYKQDSYLYISVYTNFSPLILSYFVLSYAIV